MALEVRSLGRTLRNWREQIIASHQLHITNVLNQFMNNLEKGVKRVAIVFRSCKKYQIRVLLYVGTPNWSLIATITLR